MGEMVLIVLIRARARSHALRALEAFLVCVHVFVVRAHIFDAFEGLAASWDVARELFFGNVTQRMLSQLVLVREDLAAHIAKVIMFCPHHM